MQMNGLMGSDVQWKHTSKNASYTIPDENQEGKQM